MPPHLPIFTDSKIKDANGHVLQVILFDVDAGSQLQNVTRFLHVKLVPLSTDFPSPGEKECWPSRPCCNNVAILIIGFRATDRVLRVVSIFITLTRKTYYAHYASGCFVSYLVI